MPLRRLSPISYDLEAFSFCRLQDIKSNCGRKLVELRENIYSDWNATMAPDELCFDLGFT